MFSVHWIQHEAGHGGFHSGRAAVGSGAGFNWIFDCGAQAVLKFDRLVRTWTMRNREPVDWLFISHFDADHVSGLDTLMSRTAVRDVMVPYVNERELAFELLYEINRGNLQRAFFELVADPGEFFLARGAERVTFLRSGTRPGIVPDGRPPRPDYTGDQVGWNSTVSPEPTPVSGSSRSALRFRLVEGPCEIIAAYGSLGMRLKPYRSPAAHNAHRGLIADVQSIVGRAVPKKGRPGLGKLAFAMAHHARTAAGRKELRALFAKHVGSSNRSSLSLLSTSFLQAGMNARWRVCHPRLTARGTGIAAWVNTGDAELLQPPDLEDWETNYRSDLAGVRVLALPHHGSDRNSDGTLQDLCPNAVLVAHVRSGAPKHPGANVSCLAHKRLTLVTEQPGTALHMRMVARL